MCKLLFGLTTNLIHLVAGTKPSSSRIGAKAEPKAVRAMVEIQNASKGILDVSLRTVSTLVLITLTGGLYLFWIGFKVMVKACEIEHKKS